MTHFAKTFILPFLLVVYTLFGGNVYAFLDPTISVRRRHKIIGVNQQVGPIVESFKICSRTTTIHRMTHDDHQDVSSVKKHDEQNTLLVSRSTFLSTSLLAALATTLPSPAFASETNSTTSSQQSPMDHPLPSLEMSQATTDNTTPKQKSTTSTTSTSTALEETISGFVAGAALAATKTIVKYPLDTATVRIQMPNSHYSVTRPLELLDGSYRGIVTPLISTIPAGAVFFAVKDATKEFLKSSGPAGLPRWGSTTLAVLAATFPYMLVRNPSEVIKTRLQAGVEGYGEGVSALEAFQKVRQGSNDKDGKSSPSLFGDLYLGYWENVAYTFPADVLKFVFYENLTGGRKNLSPLEGAAYGATATGMAQLLTTPLDVVRNRVMARKKAGGGPETKEDSSSYIGNFQTIVAEEGVGELFAGSIPRVGKAILSGAIQFATYEETKQEISKYFQRRG